MDTLLFIEEYFSSEPTEDLKAEFENRIQNDRAFAEDVAFYLSAKQVMNNILTIEKKERFKELYTELRKENNVQPDKSIIRKIWPYIAVAAVLISVVIGWVFFKPESTAQITDQFVKQNFQTLGVKMGGKEDSLQAGVRLFNEGKLADAQRQFESIIRNDTASIEAKKYAGIVSFRLEQYDKALDYFTQLGNYSLYANPGKFYSSITLLKRNRPGDKQKAKELLQQVLQNDLEGKETAKDMLDKW